MTDCIISEEELNQIREWAYNDNCITVSRKIDEVLTHPLSEALKAERMELLKDLQKFIDDADSHIGCPNGTLGTAYLVRWMSARGYDCD